METASTTTAPRRAARALSLVALTVLATMVVPSRAPAATPIEGTWRTIGHNQVLTIAKGASGSARRITQYDLTAISCLKNATLNEVSDSGGVVTFAQDGVRAMTVRRDGEQLVLRSLGAATDVRLSTPATRPACPTAVPSSAAKRRIKTFDIFWQTLSENYPPYTARPLDDRQRARDRAELVAVNTKTKLSQLLRRTVVRLGDMHTGLATGNDINGVRPGTRDSNDIDQAPIQPAIEARLGRSLRNALGKQVQYATLPNRLGYLRMTNMSDFTGTDGSFPADVAKLSAALDRVFRQGATNRWRGLILDLRLNDGGYDGISLELASRLTEVPHFAFGKRVRDLAIPSGFTPFQEVTVSPSTRPGFTGPIALLVSDLTVSAGETAAMTLLNRTPTPRLIGRATQGVFSDQLGRVLPGGWELELSNEDYRTADGISYEGRGLPVRDKTPVFTEDELANRCDSGIARALDVLNRRPRGTTPACR